MEAIGDFFWNAFAWFGIASFTIDVAIAAFIWALIRIEQAEERSRLAQE
jgi:hypothetical protein